MYLKLDIYRSNVQNFHNAMKFLYRSVDLSPLNFGVIANIDTRFLGYLCLGQVSLLSRMLELTTKIFANFLIDHGDIIASYSKYG